MTKLNTMRLLDARRVSYEVYAYDPSGAFHSGVDAARALGAPAAAVYKTLIVVREPASAGKPLVVMLAADRDLDLKLLAKSLGKPKQRLRMATKREAESLTDMQTGGISPLALLNRGFEICLDAKALSLERVHISAGQRGLDVYIAVKDLLEITRAKVVDAVASEAKR